MDLVTFFLGWGIGLVPIALVWTVATVWGLVHYQRHPVPSALVALGFGVFLFHQLVWIVPQAYLMVTQQGALGQSAAFQALRYGRLALSVIVIGLVGAAGLIGRTPAPVDP